MLALKKKVKVTREMVQAQLQMLPREAIKHCEAIMDLYELGKYTLEDCCHTEGIHFRVFKSWVRDDIDIEDFSLQNKPVPEFCIPDMNLRFRECKSIAASNYSEGLRQEARNSLHKKVKGYVSKEVSETRVIDSAVELVDPETGEVIPNPNFGKLIITSQRVRLRQEAPDTNAIIFALTNVDKDNFKNRNHIQNDIKIENDNLSGLTEAELDAKIKELELKQISHS